MSPRTRLTGLAIGAALAAAVAAPGATASPSTHADDCVAGPTGTVRCFDTFREAIDHASHGRLSDAPESARAAARSPRVLRELRRLGRTGAVAAAPDRAAPAHPTGPRPAPTRPTAPRAARATVARPASPTSPGRATPRAVGDGGGEIIAATLFDDQGFGGGSYTVTAGAPCKKDGLIEWQIDLPEEWRDRISSVQPWGNCWIWLYPELGLNGDRDGPFKENGTYVGPRLDNRTTSVGLS